MNELQKIVIPKIMNNWREVAEGLGYDNENIQTIKESECGDARRCCREFFRDWLGSKRGTSPKTWSTLLNVIKDPDWDLFEDSIVEEMITKIMQLQC